MPVHYRISYEPETYYHVYASANIDSRQNIDIINSNRCQRFERNQNDTIPHNEQFDQTTISEHNGIASIFMISNNAPMEHPPIYHVYVNNGTIQTAVEEMISFLNQLNNNFNPVVIIL